MTQMTVDLRNIDRQALKQKIRASHSDIRKKACVVSAPIISRTKACNRKSPHQTLEQEQEMREAILAEQIKSWRALLPTLIKRFSKIKDPRQPGKIKHQLTAIMMYGLFAFIFRLTSRRDMNRELTGPVIFSVLQKLFPEIDSIPHADTLHNVLKSMSVEDIERTHVALIQQLIMNKKFKPFLIDKQYLPISIDGSQKITRDGFLQDEHWLERVRGNPENPSHQQYVSTLDANITLKNGFSIPLLTEFLYTHNNRVDNSDNKQDCEINAFERLSGKLKRYFPKLKIILLMDKLYACYSTLDICEENNWQYIIKLPKRNLTDIAKFLTKQYCFEYQDNENKYHRKREQTFRWCNLLSYGIENDWIINVVSCSEKWYAIDDLTGEIKPKFSEHAWISSIPISISNVLELCNDCARKLYLIEDSFNTQKNRGYQHKHAFSYDFNAMKGFHYLMRLARAINAICEFTKGLKKYIRKYGVSPILKLIKETLCSPWLPLQWYAKQTTMTPQLCLQLE